MVGTTTGAVTGTVVVVLGDAVVLEVGFGDDAPAGFDAGAEHAAVESKTAVAARNAVTPNSPRTPRSSHGDAG